MYVIINKKSKDILHINYSGAEASLSHEEIYGDFSPKTMQIIESKHPIPTQFKVNAQNKIVPLSILEQVREGIIQPENLVAEAAINGDYKELINQLKKIISNDGIKTFDSCKAIIGFIDKCIENAIAVDYPIGYEMKLTKEYLSWLKEGNPENDSREEEYEIMQKRIDQIKSGLRASKVQLKKLLKKLPETKQIPMQPLSSANTSPPPKQKESSTKPDGTWTKAKLQAYLKKKKIAFTTKETKSQLLAKIK